MFELGRTVRHAVYWFLQRHSEQLEIEATVGQHKPAVAALLRHMPEAVTGRAERRLKRAAAELQAAGLSRALAERCAALSLMTQMLDIIEVAQEHRLPETEIARLYFELGRGLKLDWIGEQIESLEVQGRWRAMARGALREQLAREQRTLLRNVLRRRGKVAPRAALNQWLGESKAQIKSLRKVIDEIQSVGESDFATLSVALKEVSRLSAAS